MSSSVTLLPGQHVPQGLLASGGKPPKSLGLGPGLQFTPPATVTACTPGVLSADNRKKLAWIETSGTGRVSFLNGFTRPSQSEPWSQYVPCAGDLVIATVHHSSAERFLCSLTTYTSYATLGHLAFESANRKNRPNLQPGSVVYARISLAHKHLEPELECLNSSTGKADGMGELKEGMIFDVSQSMARRLMFAKTREEGGVCVLDEFGEKGGAKFEIAVGRNGKVWINSERTQTTIAIGKALKETDEKFLGSKEQEKVVRRLMRDSF